MLDRLVRKDVFKTFIINLSVGDIVSTDELTRQLVLMGYEHVELVESPGQFAIRGGIIDIYSGTLPHPYRIELWDDEIDSIRQMDPLTQRSSEKSEQIEIFPMRELVFTEEVIQESIVRIAEESKKRLKQMEKKGLIEQKEILSKTVDAFLEKIKNQKTFQGIEGYVRYFYEDTVTLTDYLDKETLFIIDEPVRIKEKCFKTIQEFEESMKGRLEKGYILPRQMETLFRYEDVLTALKILTLF